MNPHQFFREDRSKTNRRIKFMIEKFDIDNHPLEEKFKSETYLVPLTEIEMGLVKALLTSWERDA